MSKLLPDTYAGEDVSITSPASPVSMVFDILRHMNTLKTSGVQWGVMVSPEYLTILKRHPGFWYSMTITNTIPLRGKLRRITSWRPSRTDRYDVSMNNFQKRVE